MAEAVIAPDAGSEKVEEVVVPPVSYTDDQQNHINGLINDAFERAFKKANQAADARIAPLKTELDALKAVKPVVAAVEEPKDKGKEKAPVVDKTVQELQARLDEMKEIADKLRQAESLAKAEADAARHRNKKTRIKEEFIRAADKIDFFDRMDVFNLVENQFDLDETDRVVILNPNTNHPRQSTSGNMSIDEFISDFVKTKPHMVRSKAAAGGTGAAEARKVETPAGNEPVDYSKLSPADFAKLRDQVISGGYKR